MYASMQQLKTYLGITTTDDDGLLAVLLARAQTMIETHTRRVFEYGTAAARKFDAVADVDGALLWLDEDCCAISSVTNGDGTTVTSAQYVTEPRQETPYYALRLLASSNVTWTYTTDPENAITVTGKWAYSVTAPDDIVLATLRLTAFLYRQKDTATDIDRPRQLDIQFDAIGLLGDRQFEGCQRVLRRMSRCAAMSKNEGVRVGFQHGKQ